MKQHKPLQVGDRVRLEGVSYYGCDVQRKKGSVTNLDFSLGGRSFVSVRLDAPAPDETSTVLVLREQCRRLRKKAKQDTERVELWVSRKDYAGIPPLNSARLVVSRAALVPDRYARLLEVRPGERVLSREDLAKAYRENVLDGCTVESCFDYLCIALGLGLSKEGGK